LNTFSSALDATGLRPYFLNMFNTPRNHRWVTIPAAVAVLLALVTSGAAPYFLVFVPPVAALPLVIHAAVRRTEGAIAAALVTLRVAGGVIVTAGLIGLGHDLPAGALILGAGTLLLFATGSRREESRLAAATMVTGVLVAAMSWLLAWIGGALWLVLAGAAGLMTGGAMWRLEASRAPVTEDVVPRAIVAA